MAAKERIYQTKREKFVKNYLSSTAAATLAETATYPLDITKTRLQVQGEHAAKMANSTRPKVYRGMTKTAIGIAREEGLRKLWEGLPPAVLRHFVYSGSRLAIYEYLRSHVLKRNQDGTFAMWKATIAAIGAGAASQFLASPTDLVKVTMQTEGKRVLEGYVRRYKGTLNVFQVLLKERGLLGMWKGWLPNVQRGALVNLGDIVTYDTSKRFFMVHYNTGDSILTHGLASICSGFIASVMSTPADVIKTRIMGNPDLYRGSMDCFMKAVQNEGFMSLYKGFIPTWTRLAPWITIFWLSAEQFRTLLGMEGF